MQVRQFRIPIHDDGSLVAELNAFLAGHRLVEVEKQFVQDGQNSFWMFLVTYIAGPEKLPSMQDRFSFLHRGCV